MPNKADSFLEETMDSQYAALVRGFWDYGGSRFAVVEKTMSETELDQVRLNGGFVSLFGVKGYFYILETELIVFEVCADSRELLSHFLQLERGTE